MTDYLGYIVVRALSFVLCLLPLRLCLFLGRRLGGLIFILNRKRSRVAYANLKAAFCREKTPAEIRRIAKGSYQNLGQVFVELLRFPVIGSRYIKKYISVNGMEKLEAARAKNKGVIFLTAHFGNWELMSLFGGSLKLPVSVLAREQKHSRLNELLNSYRELTGCKVIKKGISTRELIKALRTNGIIGILGDQDAGKAGTFVNLFGRPASTHSGAIVFGQKTGAVVMPIFMVRVKGPYHRIDILDPIEIPDLGDSKKGITAALQVFSRVLESYVREFPAQWLWAHKRWKSTPARSILVLSDGKQGHLNQSLAVADIIKKYREDRGYAPEHTRCEVVEVKYKNKFLKPLLSVCANISGSNCQGCMRCLRLCLEADTYKRLTSTCADIVISAGSALAPVNVFMKRELNARNIVIMKPNLIDVKKFNLAIIPSHDRPRPLKNVLVTVASPNRISEEIIAKEAERFLSFVKPQKPLRLGIILGGNSMDYTMDTELMRKIITQIKVASLKLDFEILATTSRRTPKEVERFLKKELAQFPACRLLVVANEKNIEGTIPAILGLCQVVLVSGESISMISEAAASGKQILVFMPEKKAPGYSKHELLVGELDSMGYIKFIDTNNISAAVEAAFGAKMPVKRLSDYDKIYNAIGGVL